MTTRKRIRTYQPSVTGGGGSVPTVGNVAWGPDFGEHAGNDGKTLGAAAALDLESVDMSGNVGAAAQIKMSSVALDYATPGSFTFTVPTGATSVLARAWGGGAAGGAASVSGGGGGGAGAYSETSAITNATPGATLTITVAATSTGAGNDSWVSVTGSAPASTANGVLAKGGSVGGTGSAGGQGAGGAGGASASGIGTTRNSGGAGGGGGGIGTLKGGGGGGGAGTGGAGGAGASAGTAGTGTATGGGNGGAGGVTTTPGGNGSNYGGGGGGASSLAANGNGAQGRVSITITF